MSRSLHSSSTRRLFGLLSLRRPEQWQEASQAAIARCESLVSELLVQPPSVDTIRGLDEISDTVQTHAGHSPLEDLQICQSYDTAEFCRNVHSCEDWQAAAQQACITLGGYVHKLNINEQLYNHLVRALDKHDSAVRGFAAGGVGDNGCVEGYTPEALRVGYTLKHDFEKAGIHLPEDQRGRLTALVDLERRIGMQIGQNLKTLSKLGYLDMDVSGQRKANKQPSKLPLSQGSGSRRVTLDSGTLHSILRKEPYAEQREKAFTAGYSTPKDNVHLLDDLVGTRHEMAQLMGAPSYAHYTLKNATLAGCPEAVESFLLELLAAIQPKVEEEMNILRRYKAKHLGRSNAGLQLDAWDRLFYMRVAQEGECPLDYAATAAHFHVQGCIQGFKELLRAIMGIQIVEMPLEPGEGWAEKVQKLALEHEDEGRLGIIYLDLYPRPGKMGGATHFTLQCGRRLRDGSYQEAIVALVCSFGLSSGGLMSPDQAKTLLHEFGHALHSLLSRTEFQHLAGTRGPMDLMEVPSHVVERFANSPAVLKSCMRHHISGRPMGSVMVGDLQRSQGLFDGLNLHQQVVDALVDQQLHGVRGAHPASTEKIVHDVLQQHSPFTFAQGVTPHARFQHFVGYGAAYFSYPYAMALSSSIWQQYFPDGRMNRASGEHVRRTMLQVGSASEPVAYVEGILGKGHLQPVGCGHKPQICSLLTELGIT